MANAQRTRAKVLAQPKAEDLRILDALKKSSVEAKRKAKSDGVPFIGAKTKGWDLPK